MTKKSSAYYQRLFRQRMKDRGWIKKEVWINPDGASVLSVVEERLRGNQADIKRLEQCLCYERGICMPKSSNKPWTINILANALLGSELVQDGKVKVEIIEGLEPTILLEMCDFGQLPLFVALCGDQVLVDAILWPSDEVKDVHAFNQEVLRTHKLFPLSTISLDRYPDGQDYYTMFGTLSAYSALQQVEREIMTLADNVLSAASAYAPYLKQPVLVDSE